MPNSSQIIPHPIPIISLTFIKFQSSRIYHRMFQYYFLRLSTELSRNSPRLTNSCQNCCRWIICCGSIDDRYKFKLPTSLMFTCWFVILWVLLLESHRQRKRNSSKAMLEVPMIVAHQGTGWEEDKWIFDWVFLWRFFVENSFELKKEKALNH